MFSFDGGPFMNYFFLLLLFFFPLAVFAQEDKSDDKNSLPLGILTRQEILAGRKIFDLHYVEYVPKSDPIQAIHNFPGTAEIKVIFGDWCKDSKKHVPAFIKSMEFADNKNIKITYINLDREKKEPADLITGLNIEKIPTFIVISNGKEIGRIVETPKVSVEQDLSDIFMGNPSTATNE
jgi:thiol-disulfide isomerase/thioredoxin